MKKCFAAILALLAFASFSDAGSFKVVPVRVFLGPDNKTETLKITNETADKLTVQVKAMEWDQDEAGVDVHRPTEDVVYFPRILSLEGKEERLLKIGYQKKPANVEKTFRLLLEEIPEPKTFSDNTLRFVLKINMPVFVAPEGKKAREVKIKGAKVLAGQLSFRIENSGNAHFLADSINVEGHDSEGKTVVSMNGKSHYVLSGKSVPHSMGLPEDKCAELKEILIEVKTGTDQFTLKNKLDVDKTMCKG